MEKLTKITTSQRQRYSHFLTTTFFHNIYTIPLVVKHQENAQNLYLVCLYNLTLMDNVCIYTYIHTNTHIYIQCMYFRLTAHVVWALSGIVCGVFAWGIQSKHYVMLTCMTSLTGTVDCFIHIIESSSVTSGCLMTKIFGFKQIYPGRQTETQMRIPVFTAATLETANSCITLKFFLRIKTSYLPAEYFIQRYND